MKYLEYKGYTGSIEYSPEDNLLYGQVLGIGGLISYEGETGKLLEDDFREAIDTYTYLADCKEAGNYPKNLLRVADPTGSPSKGSSSGDGGKNFPEHFCC